MSTDPRGGAGAPPPAPPLPRDALGHRRRRRAGHGHRPGADVPAGAGHQQPRLLRAQLRAPVRHQRGRRGGAGAGDRLGRVPAAAAAAPGQVRQPPADQAGRHLRAGGRGAGRAGVRRVLSVRRALDRELVRRQGRRRARRRPEPGPRHARFAVRRPGRARRAPRARSWPTCPTPAPAWCSSASATSSAPPTWCSGPAAASWSPAPAPRASSSTPSDRRRSSCARCAPTAPIAHIEGLDETPAPGAAPPPPASVRALALVQRPGFDFNTEPRFLQVTQPLPPAVVANALAVQEANREYQERALAREGLRRMYIGTLTLTPVPRRVRRGAAGGAVRQPARAAAAGAGRRRAPGGRRRPAAHRRAAGQGRAGRPDALLRGHDPAAGRCARRGREDHGRARRGARQPADHPGQPDLGRDRARCAGHRAVDQPGRHPRAARAAGGLRRPAAGRRAGPGRVRRRACSSSSTTSRSSALQHGLDHWQHAFELHAGGDGMSQDAINIVARGAELPGRGAAAGVRRHLRDRVGPARAGLGRGGAPPGARDQEPADADPAVGRAPRDEARRQGRAAPSRRSSPSRSRPSSTRSMR